MTANAADEAGVLETSGTVSPERQLQSAVQSLRDGDDRDALRELSELVAREPGFRLAQLLYGRLLGLRSGTLVPLPVDADDPRLSDLVDEYQARVTEADFAPPPGSLPGNLLELSGETRYALVADLRRSRLYVLENDAGGLHLVENYYASLARKGYGKQSAGDLRTPVGVYRIVEFRSGRSLPQKYGAGAFPLDYPNGWDRALGRDGHGIWLHGVPADTYARAPRASEGCLVLANADLLALKEIVTVGATPVVFSDRVDWTSAETLAARRDELRARIEAWREAWSAQDAAAYPEFYAEDFDSAKGVDRAPGAGAGQLRGAGQNLEVQLDQFNLFVYPGEDGLMLAQFTEDDRHGNRRTVARKSQYWRRGADGVLRIVREENR